MGVVRRTTRETRRKRTIIAISIVIALMAFASSFLIWDDWLGRAVIAHKSQLDIDINYDGQDVDLYNERALMTERKIPYDHHPKGLDGNALTEPAIDLNISSIGFEKSASTDKPKNAIGWNYLGMIEHTSTGCYKGECLHIRADDSKYGYGIINSELIPIEQGKTYKASFMINCLNCSGDAAYITIVWMIKNDSFIYPHQEIGRNIIVLEDTVGYETKSIYAKAPERAEFAIAGIRFHEEGAKITKFTEFYVDVE
ncbi:hypothetical protein JW711_00775 [Candidatus Woesearchaeota archaeon]|nr:hypothetical protein [Candidatus Woesearchaeota archaeon]